MSATNSNRQLRSRRGSSRKCRRGCGWSYGAAIALVLAAAGVVRADPSEGCEFIRGNLVDRTEIPVVDLNDGVGILAYLFLGRSVPACLEAADVNGNGLVELADYTYLVDFKFNGGPPPPGPYPAPGIDPDPGTTVSDTPDPRFEFRIGATAGVPGMSGLSVPVTLSNEVPISGFQMVIEYNQRDASCPDLLIQEIRTEENTLLSQESAEYIIANFDNVNGVAVIAALKDFATPFHFVSGTDPNFPAGEDQLVATIVLAVASCADQGCSDLGFADGVIVPRSAPDPSPSCFALAHNLVMLGTDVARPVLARDDDCGVAVRRGFIRGDANKDDGVDVSDPVFLIDHIFRGGRLPPCLDAADANNDTDIDLSDPIWMLNYLFKGGPQPSEPFPQAGVDPSDDGSGSLGCASDDFS